MNQRKRTRPRRKVRPLLGRADVRFGSLIRLARAAKGLSEEELARRIGFSRSLVNLICTGRRRATPVVRRRLQKELGLFTAEDARRGVR